MWHVSRARPVTGLELLYGQGFPLGRIIASGYHNGELCSVKEPEDRITNAESVINVYVCFVRFCARTWI